MQGNKLDDEKMFPFVKTAEKIITCIFTLKDTSHYPTNLEKHFLAFELNVLASNNFHKGRQLSCLSIFVLSEGPVRIEQSVA